MAGFMVVFFLLLAFSMVAGAISPATADQIKPAIFAFGDSLSDVGNNNELPDGIRCNFPHNGVDFPDGPTGRFTNGYNFIDIIAQHMDFNQSPQAYASIEWNEKEVSKGVNFASGLSGILMTCMNGTAKLCITMEEQIRNFKVVRAFLQKKFLNWRELISESIFTFTCGSNDLDYFFYRKYILHVDHLPPFNEFVHNLTSTFRDQLKELYNLGARKFAIVNVPAIEMTPTIRALDSTPIGRFFQAILKYYAQTFNEAEELMLKELSSALDGMKYSIGNSYAALFDVIKHHDELGINNVTSPCCGAVRLEPGSIFHPNVTVTWCAPDAWLCSNRSEFVFWDSTHPTQAVIQYAVEHYYNGDVNYAKPINLKRLLETESSGGVSAGVPDGIEAM